MARKTRTRTVYRRAKRSYRRRKGLLSGTLGYIVLGAAAGFATKFIPPVIGKYTAPAILGAAGYFFKKPALMAIAGYQAGSILAGGGNPGNPGSHTSFYE